MKNAFESMIHNADNLENNESLEKTKAPEEQLNKNGEDLEKLDDNGKKETSLENSKKDISDILELVIENKIKIIDLYEKITKIQQDIDSLQGNTIKNLLNFFKVKKLSNERMTKEEEISFLTNDLNTAETIIMDLFGELKTRDKTKEILKFSKEHYRDDPARLAQIEEIEKEQQKRSVEDSILRNKAFIFHGIRDDNSGEVLNEESPLNQGVSQDVRIKIAAALEPSLSTSSFREDGLKQRLWSSTGLLLRGGNIDAANSWDMHTTVKNMDERDNLKVTTPADINRVIQEKRRSSMGVAWYNEIIVRNPKYAGLCVSSLEIDPNVYNVSKELDMPIFFHDGNGKVFETSLQITENNSKIILQRGKEVSPEDIVNLNYDLPQDKRNDLIREVVKEDIFNIDERMSNAYRL